MLFSVFEFRFMLKKNLSCFRRDSLLLLLLLLTITSWKQTKIGGERSHPNEHTHTPSLSFTLSQTQTKKYHRDWKTKFWPFLKEKNRTVIKLLFILFIKMCMPMLTVHLNCNINRIFKDVQNVQILVISNVYPCLKMNNIHFAMCISNLNNLWTRHWGLEHKAHFVLNSELASTKVARSLSS